ncbi:MAG TPA: PEP/pyruvate-binding domain-containing protein [Bacillota bacterium]|nr:PEP/pyruvate-binding domain-containing protein [Bacillota bacterium]HPJ86246.1 PEP/pyruvate-binding domain-containing protein [Bacillota bacterium]HPQ62337.1 PEP/pyruvate-binding domain-containing protein [Bacillota bacterium]HRX91947.1 PEP/pyruvate-binding domain-containing protein [Candidatus Izemoplasmatales bacterium]
MKIYDIGKIPADLLNFVGGKARGLYYLSQIGLAVPEGFIVTDIKSDSDVMEAAEYYEKSNLGAVAVRSSATAEDGGSSSAAGQYDTVLNVAGKDNFIQAFHRCLESLDSERVRKYNEIFLNRQVSEMTVIVQKYIDAKISGVAFTIDPLNDHMTLIEAVEGAGENLVSGSVSAIQCRHDGTEWIIPVNCFIDESHLEEIRIGSQKAKGYFGCELDVEWVVSKTGRLYWLQARPITTLDTPTIHELDTVKDYTKRVITTNNISEMMPGAVTPLTLTTSMYGIEWGMRKLLVVSGTFRRMDDIPPGSCIVSNGNHMFIDLTTLYMMENMMILTDKQGVDISICGRSLEASENINLEKAGFIRKLVNFVRYASLLFKKEKYARLHEKLYDDLTFDPQAPTKIFYENIDANLTQLNLSLFYHYVSSCYSGSMLSALNAALEPDFESPEKARAAVASVLENIDGIESVDILMSLRKIAKQVKKQFPDVDGMEKKDILSFLENPANDINRDYISFMERHGHRSVREAELRSRSWRDEPLNLAGMVKNIAAGGVFDTETDMNGWRKNRDMLLANYGFAKKKIFRYLINSSRDGVRYREKSKSMIIKVIDKFKHAYRNLAGKLVEEGLLPDEDCIFFLTHQEIGELIDKKSSIFAKQALVRRRLLPEQMLLHFDDVTIGKPEPILLNRKIHSTKLFKGTPVSNGIAIGKARVVRSLEDANELQKGEIMVAGFTDIGWSPYYCLLAGLITEVGSALSHGAVVAREYSLPLVSNIEGATGIIATGDYLYMDAKNGEVRIITEEEVKELTEEEK